MAYRKWVHHRGLNAHLQTAEDDTCQENDTHARFEQSYVAPQLDELQAVAAGARAEGYVPSPAIAAPDALWAKAIAFYLPQFHPIAENDAWWGRGFTEWTNVSKAVPQFIGHEQPHLPGELGFYDLRVPEVMRRQVELAKLHGIHAFCFHYYWFAGRRLLERPLDGFIADQDIDFPFCLCWANENWTRRWDGHDADVLLGQTYDAESDRRFPEDIAPYLRDRRYLRIQGKPLLIVYRPSLLPDCRATLSAWREAFRRNGVGEVFFAMVQFDVEDPEVYGFDAALVFPPHKVARDLTPINDRRHITTPRYSGMVLDYRDMVARAESMPVPDYPLFRGVSPRWDNEARKPGRGYTMANAGPNEYRRWLQAAVGYARAHPVAGESLVFINAWNEWAEGAFLEPDRRYGYAYLQATRSVIAADAAAPVVAVVSHDAHPHGAQYLALHLVRELRALGHEVRILLQGGGVLQEAFAEQGRVDRLDSMDADALPKFFADLARDGVAAMIANTAVSGRLSKHLADAGLAPVTLFHEMPGIIRSMSLQQAVKDALAHSRVVIASSAPVRQGLTEFVDAAALESKCALRAQGLFVRNRHLGSTDPSAARQALRHRLGLPADAWIVLSVGYAEHRKGVDLMVETAARLCVEDPHIHFVWVGHHEAEAKADADARIHRAGLASRVHFPGLDFDTDDHYAGADAYGLFSREDPLPNVVLESLAVGLPVVAFAGTGGGADLLQRGFGVTVPAFDTAAFAEALSAWRRDENTRRRLGQAGAECVAREFGFRDYVMDLLAYAGLHVPKVSAIVPNYDYARYLPKRLQSIAGQDLPVMEMLVLDDASSDHSARVVAELQSSLHPRPRWMGNARNSGSVFRQWLKGVEAARGEYVWICEADDLAEPGLLAPLVQAMRRDQRIVFAYCQSRQIDAEGRELAPDYLDYTADCDAMRWRTAFTADGDEEVRRGMAVKNTIPNVSAVLFRRQVLLEVLREKIEEIAAYRIAGDWVVYLELLKRGKVHFHPRALNLHRRHAEGVTLATKVELHLQEIAAAQEHARRLFPAAEAQRLAAADYLRRAARHLGITDPLKVASR